MEQEKNIILLSQLLRELEAEIGTNGVAHLVLNALIDSIKVIQNEKGKEFCADFQELVTMISNTEPKFGILNYYFTTLLHEFSSTIDERDLSERAWKELALTEIEKILASGKVHLRELVKHAEAVNVEHKTILIHDHSHTVQDVLCHFKSMGRHFKVIIAEQDFEKTHDNIERMHGAQIPFQVIPAYMLSHVHDRIDMAFFGGLTLKDTMDFVMDPGTHGIISEFHVVGVPIYMFIDTSKFSLWKSKPRGEVFMHHHRRQHFAKPIQYDRIKYSHDRVPSPLFAQIITNEGIFAPKELKTLFMRKLDEFTKKKKIKPCAPGA